MKIIRNPEAFQKEMRSLRGKGRRIGFVPTMGALHAGHLALVKAALRQNDIVAVSIFVNPAQFGPKEDLSRYPRPFRRDTALLKKAGAHYLFAPSAADLYPAGFTLCVDELEHPGLTDCLCGKSRPGHFRGVMTVCAKLFNLAQPHSVYFGQKDYQQSAVIAVMLREFHWGIRFRRIATVREADGLALSSRNIYLSPEDRKRACALSKTLFFLQEELRRGRKDLPALLREARSRLTASFDKLDYLEIVDPATLKPLVRPQAEMAALGAAFLGKTRLIDNVIIRLSNRGRIHA